MRDCSVPRVIRSPSRPTNSGDRTGHRDKGDAAALVETMAREGVLAGVPVSRLLPGAGLDDLLLVANTEINTAADRDAFLAALDKGAKS